MSFGHPNHPGIQSLSGLRFLTDYQQYMDFSHYMGKGLHQQMDSSTHFKDLSGGTWAKKQITRRERSQR